MAKKRAHATNAAPKKKRTAPDWAPKCLVALARAGNVSEACQAAGIDRTTFYRRRDNDPVFAAAASDAIEQAVDAMEAEAHRRAVQGCERPVFHQGQECGRIKEYSDTLMIFLLKAHRPEKYRENVKHEHSGQVRVAISAEDLSDDELAAIAARKPG